MRLQANDLISYAQVMGKKTNNKYEIIATKSEYGYWKMEIKNNENGHSEILVGGLTLREANEALRGMYAMYRFLNPNQ